MSEPALFLRLPHGFVPAGEVAQKFFSKVKPGEVVRLEPKRSRSLPWHRRYWALIALVAANTSYSKTQVHNLYKLRCGCSMDIIERSGDVVTIPDSIAFDRMSPEEWADYWERVVAYTSELLPGVTSDVLMRQLGELAGIGAP